MSFVIEWAAICVQYDRRFMCLVWIMHGFPMPCKNAWISMYNTGVGAAPSLKARTVVPGPRWGFNFFDAYIIEYWAVLVSWILDGYLRLMCSLVPFLYKTTVRTFYVIKEQLLRVVFLPKFSKHIFSGHEYFLVKSMIFFFLSQRN